MPTRLAPILASLLTCALLAGCGTDDPENGDSSKKDISEAIVAHFKSVQKGLAPPDAGEPAHLAGSRFARGLDPFDIDAIEVTGVSGSTATGTATISGTWTVPLDKADGGETPDAPSWDFEQPVLVGLSHEEGVWRVTEMTSSVEALRVDETTHDHMALSDPAKSNLTEDYRTTVARVRIAVEWGEEGETALGKELVERFQADIGAALAGRGLTVEVADASAADTPTRDTLDLTISVVKAISATGFAAFNEIDTRILLKGEGPFAKPEGGWRFTYMWQRVARTIGVADAEKESRRMIDQAAGDLVGRFAGHLAGAVEGLNERSRSAVVRAWRPDRATLFADVPATPAVAHGEGDTRIVLIRTRGQQIQAYGPDGTLAWTAADRRLPARARDPRAYEDFTRVPILVLGDGRIAQPETDPDPPHEARVAVYGADGSEAWAQDVDAIPVSGCAELADGSLLVAALGREIINGKLRVRILYFKPEGDGTYHLDARRRTEWFSAEPEPFELHVGGDWTLHLVARRRIGSYHLDGKGTDYERSVPGMTPNALRVLTTAEGDLLYLHGEKVLRQDREGASEPTVFHEAPGTIAWIRRLDDGRIVLASEKTVTVLDEAGAVATSTDLPVPARIPAGPGLDGGLVVGSRRILCGIDAEGEVLWQTPYRGDDGEWPPMLIGDGDSRRVAFFGIVRSLIDARGHTGSE